MKLEPPVVHRADPDPERWNSLVAASEGASVFHTAEWARLWTEEWGDARWEALVVEDAVGYAAGLGAIVRRRGPFRTVDAMPFATYGGPIVRRGHPDPGGIAAALLEGFARWIGGATVLRAGLAWYEGDREAFPERLVPVESFTHVLPLGPDYEEVAARFSPSTRRLVRQADESGLTIEAADTPEKIGEFYAMAVETVRRRGGTPKPRSLYDRIHARLAPRGLGRFHLVRHGGEAVAGSLHFFHEGVATNWLPVSRASAWTLRPNNFLVASLLETLCASGYVSYNFGASPSDAAGLIRFKEGWGARRRAVLLAGRRTGLHRRLRP
ncbi:MAG TPA: GNAT family N-acetyltransferase [Candidatus Eisenbacteria bacterium]|nr:GNAT family N-acetyltransferase [Candidatus Eisenbacteria bacterium]